MLDVKLVQTNEIVTEQTSSLYSAFCVVLDHSVNLLSCFNRKGSEALLVERVEVKHGKENQKATGDDRCPSRVSHLKQCVVAGLCVLMYTANSTV